MQTSKLQQPNCRASSASQYSLTETKPEAFNEGKRKIGAVGNTKLSKGNTKTQMTLAAAVERT